MKKYAFAAAAVVAFAATAALAGNFEGKADDAAMNAKMEAHFKEVDKNADGQISEQELVDFVTAKAKAEFASMAGDDGLVSKDEMQAHHKSKMGMMMKERGDDKAEHKEGHH